jgi:arsenate reductase
MDPSKVVFACVENAGRSQMAAAFFNRLASPKRARAISAGTRPGERVHPGVVAVMQEAGFDLSAAQPQYLSSDLSQGAHILITMGCGEECPLIPNVERDDWPIPDPKGQPLDRVREIRDQIRKCVVDLIRERRWG